MKPVRLSRHAQQQLAFRGCSSAEIMDAIRSAAWEPADLGRLQCRMTFEFRGEWNGVWYPLKEVRPIFVDDPGEIVVVTVYVYYSSGDAP